MSLIWISSILLFLLLFLNTLAVERTQLFASARGRWRHTAVAMGLIFVFFPLLLAAASKLLLKDSDFAFGMVVSALAPCALVNPFFAKLRGGDDALSLVNVILSTMLCPLVTVPMLHALGYESIYLDSRYTIFYLLSLTLIPVSLSFTVGALWPQTRRSVEPSLPYLNSLILAVLMFILVGSSLSRMPFRFLAQGDLPRLIVLFLISDFGFYFLIRGSARLFTDARSAETLALSVASRNFAVSASLMLFFHPKAALPAAIGLTVHALFFQFLTWSKRGSLALVFLLGLIPLARAESSLNAGGALSICLPPYGEVPGTATVLAARRLGYFDREEIQVTIKVVAGNPFGEAGKGNCDVGLVTRAQVDSAPAHVLKKFRPLFYLVPGVGSPPRLFVLNGKTAHLRDLTGKTIRVANLQDQEALTKHFLKMRIGEPKFVIEADPSRALESLRAKKIDAAVMYDPLAGAMLAGKDFKWIETHADDLDAPKSQKVPAAFFFKGPDRPGLSGLVTALMNAAEYLESNPTESFRFFKDEAVLLGLKGELDGFLDLTFAGHYFSWVKTRIPSKNSRDFKRDHEALNARSPAAAAWLNLL